MHGVDGADCDMGATDPIPALGRRSGDVFEAISEFKTTLRKIWSDGVVKIYTP